MSKPVDLLRPAHPQDRKGTASLDFRTALRLAQYFGGDAAPWLALQANYDLKRLLTRAEIEQRVPHRAFVVA